MKPNALYALSFIGAALLVGGCLTAEEGAEQPAQEADSVLPPSEEPALEAPTEIGPDTPLGCPEVVDFDDLPAGTGVTTQYTNVGISGIVCTNNNPAHPNSCILFDSGAPTGGDSDLGTPNADFSGPGVGNGGGLGMVGVNDTPLNNLLIVAENDSDTNNDGLVDDPDDEATGGTIEINFDEPTTVNSLTVVDIDNNEGGMVEVVVPGTPPQVFPFAKLGDNSVQEVAIGVDDAASVTVHFVSSGAVAGLSFCQDNGGPVGF